MTDSDEKRLEEKLEAASASRENRRTMRRRGKVNGHVLDRRLNALMVMTVVVMVGTLVFAIAALPAIRRTASENQMQACRALAAIPVQDARDAIIVRQDLAFSEYAQGDQDAALKEYAIQAGEISLAERFVRAKDHYAAQLERSYNQPLEFLEDCAEKFKVGT